MSDGHSYDAVATATTATVQDNVAIATIQLEKVDTLASAESEPVPTEIIYDNTAKPSNATVVTTSGIAGALELKVDSKTDYKDGEEEYEHKTLSKDTSVPPNNFESLTQDVSFGTKLCLILWKNAKIQCLRRPASFCIKLSLPFSIMLIMFLIKSLVELEVREAEEGYEFEYLLGGSEQALMYQQLSSSIDNNLYQYSAISNQLEQSQELPFPDTSVMFPWVKYLVCPRSGRDILIYYTVIPSYIAIIPDISADARYSALWTIMQNKYGNTSEYYTSLLESTLSEFVPSSRRRLGEYQSKIDQNENYRRYLAEDDSDEATLLSCWENAGLTNYLNFTEGSLIKFFDSESELTDYISDSSYGSVGYNFANDGDPGNRPIGIAIVFDDVSDDGKEWTYTLRFNSSHIPETETVIDKFERSGRNLFHQSNYYYIYYSGFLQMQAWLDHAIMEAIADTAGVEYNSNYTDGYQKGAFMFPSAEYVYDPYWEYVGSSFIFFCFIMFSYPVIQVLSILIEEKASKIKEGMKMMGATTSTYWLSWFIWFFCEFTLICATVTVVGIGGKVFRFSSGGVIFVWYWMFCLSSGAFAMLLSTLFDNPKTGSLVGFILYFALIVSGQFSGTLSESGKTGLCLLAPACFTISLDNLIIYETGAIGLHWDNIGETYEDFKFETSIIMMFIDTLIYSLLVLYLDQVFPSRYGQKQVPWFFILPSYWGCGKDDNTSVAFTNLRRNSRIDDEAYESMIDVNEPTIHIRRLSKSFKTGFLNRGKLIRAVNSISLDIYSGEVFCLLGHNGAGKTTTIGMLTGLLEPTSGDAWIDGHHITHEMESIRKNLGVCPQHDVLWARLTCREHLWLFCRLKGVPKERVQQQVEETLRNTGLYANGCADKFPTGMSGGQRRKLSLGIALIGGSKVVFLDEPTSGMDPQSRRVTWDLISKEKKNRCIILTTHFMDEADILGDRIAIMGSGVVKCCGSALYLKRLYGAGYTFTVSLNAGTHAQDIKPAVDGYVLDMIPGAEDVALAGAELTYRLPFEKTHTFANLFRELDEHQEELCIRAYGISVTTLEEVFLKIGHDEPDDDELDDEFDDEEDEEKVETTKLSGGGQSASSTFVAPPSGKLSRQMSNAVLDKFPQPTFQLQDQNSFEIFFRHIYAILYKRFWWSVRDVKAIICQLLCPVAISALILGLLNIQIATNQPDMKLDIVDLFDSSEDVFIPFAQYSGNNADAYGSASFVGIDSLYTNYSAWMNTFNSDSFGDLYSYDNFTDDKYCEMCNESAISSFSSTEFAAYAVLQFCNSSDYTLMEDVFDGDYTTCSTDVYTQSLEIYSYLNDENSDIVSALTAAIACISSCVDDVYPTLYSLYNYSFCATTDECPNYMSSFDSGSTNYDFVTNFAQNFRYTSTQGITYAFQNELLDTVTEDRIPYNAFWWVLTPSNTLNTITNRIYFGVNSSALHALPITLNMWNNWILNKQFDADGKITAYSHPLPVTERQDLISSQISGFFAALYLVIAFTFIPAGAMYFIVNEKTNLTKHQQLVSGISFVSYWCANYIADFFLGLPASVLVFCCVFIFDNEAFNTTDAAGPFFLTLLMFLFSCLPFTYLLSYAFQSPSKAQLATVLIYIIFGMILGLVSFILDLIPDTIETNKQLKPLYRIFPVFLMCEGLLNISLKKLLFLSNDYFDWEVTSRNLVLMFVEGVGYFSLVLLIEYLSTFPALLAKLGFVVDKPIVDEKLDEDVQHERDRIQAGVRDNMVIDRDVVSDTVVLAGLRKVYGVQGKLIPCQPVDDRLKNVAVKDLWFGVKQGEVFGFLGVNGAGKTTTLATLTGERYASSGNAYIHGFSIANQLQCRRYVGYCPQFDAIFELLTAKEHLKFYAMIKGLSGDDLDEQINVLLKALTLTKYENRTAGTYSGGNKRKLSVAVSMIGNPPVIFLDEPSTGMDPVSRRHMWEFISQTMQGRCVILTTHSMEECEALCHRLGIMVGGQLQCIGTTQHLKSRFGQGHQLDLTLMDDKQETEEIVERELHQYFQATRIEKNGTRISYEIEPLDADQEMRLSDMFGILEEMKKSAPVQSYALSQTTLEQIFIRMAKTYDAAEKEKQDKKSKNKYIYYD